MKPLPLPQARQVWQALFRAGVNLSEAQWQAWADAQLLDEQTPPSWLLALSTAQSRGAALAAVEHDIGLESECTLDAEALVIGLVVERHLRGELSLDGMWGNLREVADIAEFLDSGKWKGYGSEAVVRGEQSDPLSIRLLTPVASFASEKLSSLLSVVAKV
jgi:hypothetical protein